MIQKSELEKLYINQNKSTSEIAKELCESRAKVLYWLRKYSIPLKESNSLGKNLAGKKFYYITFIKHLDKRYQSGERIWKCKCDCGNELELPSSYFKKQKSCGCIGKQKGLKCSRWKGYNEISGSLWLKIKTSAKKRGLEFNITIEQIWELFEKQKRRCALSGLELNIGCKSRNITASLDRIDSSRGYTISNIQWVHKKINFMKQNYSEQEFIELCKMVVSYNESRFSNL